MTSHLRAEKLLVTKGERRILGDVSVTLAPGRLTALIGPNGAGKSTLLRALCGLEELQDGTVTLGVSDDVLAMQSIDRARRIAWVPASSDGVFGFTVLEATILGRYPWHLGSPAAHDRERALAALRLLGITDLADRPTTELSSGEQRKVAIARALASDARILLLDEPCANLDLGAALALLALLQTLARQDRVVCLTLHDLSLAHRFVDDGLCLKAGELKASGPIAQSLSPPVVREVFGVQTELAKGSDGIPTLIVSTPRD